MKEKTAELKEKIEKDYKDMMAVINSTSLPLFVEDTIEDMHILIETLIAEYKELKEENFNLKQQKIIDKCSIPSQDNFYDYYNYIEKSKVEEIIEELRNDTCKIINRTYIPTISSKLFNNNREKYEPMLEARNILINALNKLQSLLGKE